MLINHFQHLERYEGETFGPALVVRGAPRAALTDPHDGPRDRRGARPAGHSRRIARA